MFFQFAADLDYLCNYMMLAHFNNKLHPCFKCWCNRADVPWPDLGPSARWRRLPISLAGFLVMTKHPLFDHNGVGLTWWHILLDVLHCLCLGLLQHIGGSIIWMLIFDTELPGGWKEAIPVVWTAIDRAQRALAAPVGEQLSHTHFVSMFDSMHSPNPPEYPVLHSKGAVARHTMQTLKLVIENMADWTAHGPHTGDPTWKMVELLLNHICRFYDIILQNGMWLPHEDAQEAHDALQSAGCLHQALANHFMHQGSQAVPHDREGALCAAHRR